VNRARRVAQAGAIAAVYAALTLLVLQYPISYGPVQLRLSEALVVVAVLTPAAPVGLALGSAIANAFMLNIVGTLGLLDVVFGSIATLLGAVWSWRLRARTRLALLGPVVTNALIVPAYLPIMLKGLGFYRIPLLGIDLEGRWLEMYLFGVVAVGVGEAVVVYGLGLPLLAALKRTGISRVLGDAGPTVTAE
jgi:uncharacterized membrane protein